MSNKKRGENSIYSWGADDLKTNAAIIENTLLGFGLLTKVMEINALRFHVQYCIELGQGISVNDVLNHEVDLALALSSSTGKIKIIAPIPNTHYIGINLPKRKKPLEKRTLNIVTANDKIVRIRDLNLLVEKFPKRRLNVLVNDALNYIYRNKFDVVGIILFQKELKIMPKEAIVVFKELVDMEVILNPRSEEGKPGVAIGDVDWSSLKKFTIN